MTPSTSKSPTQLGSPERRAKWLAFIQILNPDADPSTIRLMDQMRQVAHMLYQTGESSLADAGLSYAKFRLLLSLLFAEEFEGESELNPSEISRRQGTSRNTISALIRDLEADGLVDRHLDEADRRKFNICLTPAGRNRVREHAQRHMQAIDARFDRLTAGEQTQLGRLLAKLDPA